MEATTYQFIGRCDSLDADDLDAFDNSSKPISNRTFRKRIGKEAYRDFEKSLGYDRLGLTLSGDYHVSYQAGRWRGKPAVCCKWSAYHHIWSNE